MTEWQKYFIAIYLTRDCKELKKQNIKNNKPIEKN